MYNSVVDTFNNIGDWSIERSSRAPASNPIEFYSDRQIWFAIVVGLLSGIGQFFSVEKIREENFLQTTSFPAQRRCSLQFFLLTFTKYTP